MASAREGEKERKKIKDELQEFPHSFKLQLPQDLTDEKARKSLKSQKNHLVAALKSGYETTWETARTKNLLSYILFRLDKSSDKAFELLDEVLEMEDQKNNLVTLANKAHMLSQRTDLDDARDVADKLKELKAHPDYNYLVVKAKAELASSYMRFGPRLNQLAAECFLEVLRQAKEPEVWMWKFGLAVTYRQALSLQFVPHVTNREDHVLHRTALRLLQEVVDSKTSSNNLKANAHVEIALLLRSTWDKDQQKALAVEAKTGPLASCKTALRLAPDDPTVLWKAGKVYRHYKDVFHSRTFLEKSVALQESSWAYHHLGLTYKAMATNDKYGKLKTRRAGKRQQQRRAAKQKKVLEAEQEKAEQSHRGLSSLSPTVLPSSVLNSRPRSALSARERSHKAAQSDGDRIKKAVKSPNSQVTHLSLEDPKGNVQSAVKNFEKAIEFSCGENSRAVYDLGVLYKQCGNNEEALKLFDQIGNKQIPAGELEVITSLEQMGLIYKQKAEEETDIIKKNKLQDKSKKMLLRALARAAQMYSHTPEMKDKFRQIFHAPSVLLEAVDSSETSETEKKKEKAEIYRLAQQCRKSLTLLQDIDDEHRDASYYYLKIRTYYFMAQNYEEPIACLALLKTTKEDVYKQVIEKLGQDFVVEMYLKAGEKALKDGINDGGHFASAFDFVFGHADNDGGESRGASGSSPGTSSPTSSLAVDAGPRSNSSNSNKSGKDDDSSSSDTESKQVAGADVGMTEIVQPPSNLHVFILNDEEEKSVEIKAKTLARLLKTACGLNVESRDDFMPGTVTWENIEEDIMAAHVTLVLPGNKPMLDEFELALGWATLKLSAVALLTEGVKCPKGFPGRSMDCPASLLAHGDAAQPARLSPDVIRDLCQLLRFMLGRRNQA